MLPLAAVAATLTGRVVAVADGDTITVLDSNQHQYRIRLGAIDAPERSNHSARAFASTWQGLFRLNVNIEWNKIDRYGRLIGKVWTVAPCLAAPCPLALDANLAQIRAGMAWHYKQYEREQSAEDREAYAAAEQEARANGIGLWADTEPGPPWEWRVRKRNRQP